MSEDIRRQNIKYQRTRKRIVARAYMVTPRRFKKALQRKRPWAVEAARQYDALQSA